MKPRMRASERIQELYGQQGELSNSRGELFIEVDGTWQSLLGPAVLAAACHRDLSRHFALADRQTDRQTDTCIHVFTYVRT